MRYRKSKLLYRWFNSITHSTFWNRVRWTELWKSIFLSPPNTIPKSRMIEFCNFTLHDGWRRYAQLKQAMTTVYAMARNFSCQWGKNSWQCVGMRVRWNSACHTSWRKFRNFEKNFQGVNEKKNVWYTQPFWNRLSYCGGWTEYRSVYHAYTWNESRGKNKKNLRDVFWASSLL